MTHSIILIIGIVYFSMMLLHTVFSFARNVKNGKAHGIEHCITLSNVMLNTAIAFTLLFIASMLHVLNNNILLILVLIYSTLARIFESAEENMYRIEPMGIQDPSKLLPFDELGLLSYRKKWFSPLLLVQVMECSNNKVHRFLFTQDDFEAIHKCFKTLQ